MTLKTGITDMLDRIDKDRFYQISELILMGIDDDILISVTPVRMNGKRLFWGLDIMAEMGNQGAIDQRNLIEKAYSFKKLKKGNA